MLITPEELACLFLDGDDQLAMLRVQEYLKNYSRQELFNKILTPAMHHIGNLWEHNEISVADEHLATSTCDFVMSALDFQTQNPVSHKGKALVFGVEGEQHYLGLKMVSSLLRENGWNVRYLGPDLPLDHALKAAADWQPDLIGLSASLVYRLPAVKTYVASLQKLTPSPSILIGGRAIGMADLSEIVTDKTYLFNDLTQLEQWVQQGGGRAQYAHIRN